MSNRWMILVTDKKGIDTLCKKKIFVDLIRDEKLTGSLIDDVLGGIYWISIDLPLDKDPMYGYSRFFIEEFTSVIKSLKYYEYVIGGSLLLNIVHRVHIPPEYAKYVRVYLLLNCTVITNSKMSKKLEFGVDNENEHP